MKARIEEAEARYWLRGKRADLVLTDPPHLDTFTGYTERDTPQSFHLRFVRGWLPEALKLGCPVVHSCGPSPTELDNYLKVAQPTAARIWVHQAGHHFLLFHGVHFDGPAILDWAKPHPLWNNLIAALTYRGDVVADPFCGRGEIPAAAQEEGRRFRGCDIDPVAVAHCRSRGL